MGRLTARVLGSAAGGGFPQGNCRCPTCRLAWAGDARVRPRTQASLAVTADGENWLLINASPDLPQQLRQNQAAPSGGWDARKSDKSGGAHGRRNRSGRGLAEPAGTRTLPVM